jgi:hypothetical protein
MLSQTSTGQEDLGLVLHTCLEKLESGEESIDTLLPRYPEIKELLRPPLEAALWLYKKSWLFDPNPAFVSASRNRLIGQVEEELGILFPARRNQTGSLSPSFQRWNTISFVVYLSIVLLLLFIGIKTIGFWIGNSLPGDPLYRIKLANEQVQLAISFSEEMDVQLSIRFVERRMVEGERIILSGRESYLPLAILRFEAELKQANQNLSALTQVDPPRGEVNNLLLENVLTAQANKLEALRGFYPQKSQDFIDQVIWITSDEIQD